MSCVQVIENVQVTTLYGYYDIWDPQSGENGEWVRIYVALGTDTTIYYGMQCTDDIDVSDSGGGQLIPARPQAQILHVDTSDPNRPILSVSVQSGDWSYPITDIELFWADRRIGSVPSTGDGNYDLLLPEVTNIGDGGWDIRVSACNNYGSCGYAYGKGFKFTQSPAEAVEDIQAYYVQNKYWKLANYTHKFAQIYSTMTWSMTEYGQNSRVHLKENAVSIHLEPATPKPYLFADVRSEGTLRDTSSGTSECGGQPVCYIECVYKCGYLGGLGAFPAGVDEINGLYNPDVPAWMQFTGGSLRVEIP